MTSNSATEVSVVWFNGAEYDSECPASLLRGESFALLMGLRVEGLIKVIRVYQTGTESSFTNRHSD